MDKTVPHDYGKKVIPLQCGRSHVCPWVDNETRCNVIQKKLTGQSDLPKPYLFNVLKSTLHKENSL